MKVLLVALLCTLLERAVLGFTTSPTARPTTAFVKKSSSSRRRSSLSPTSSSDWFRSRTHSTSSSATTTQCFAKLDGRTIQGEVKPLNNFLLVKVADAVEETGGGILLTGKAKIVKTEGTVISVGPGRTHQDSGIVFDMPVSPGDGVVYGKFDGTELDLDGKAHTLIRDDDILVKFEGSSELSLDTVSVTYDNILVHVDTSEQESEGGILIAKSSKTENKPSTGTVVKVGPGRMASNGELMAMEVAEGDMVKFRDFMGSEVTIGDQEYSVVKMSDILAKF